MNGEGTVSRRKGTCPSEGRGLIKGGEFSLGFLLGHAFLDGPLTALASTTTSCPASNNSPELVVGKLGGGGFGGGVIAAAGKFENFADPANAGSGFLAHRVDHFAPFLRGFRPRMTAAFFKMSFSN